MMYMDKEGNIYSRLLSAKVNFCATQKNCESCPLCEAEMACTHIVEECHDKAVQLMGLTVIDDSAVADPHGMSTELFNSLFEEQVSRSRDVLCAKAKEYATADRLHNFRVAAALRGCTPAQALAGMMVKHTVSIYDMCESGEQYPLDLWQEKITDSINYLLLLNAMVREGRHA